MLGSLSEADDAVQDAWLRLSRSDTSGVENLRGWLTTIVARVCLDMLRSRRARREESLGAQLRDLLICDELGFVRLDPDQAQLLFTLLAHRYTRGALIVTSNLEFADWTGVDAGRPGDNERAGGRMYGRLGVALRVRCPEAGTGE